MAREEEEARPAGGEMTQPLLRNGSPYAPRYKQRNRRTITVRLLPACLPRKRPRTYMSLDIASSSSSSCSFIVRDAAALREFERNRSKKADQFWKETFAVTVRTRRGRWTAPEEQVPVSRCL